MGDRPHEMRTCPRASRARAHTHPVPVHRGWLHVVRVRHGRACRGPHLLPYMSVLFARDVVRSVKPTAISHAMARDGSSGGNIRLVIIDEAGVERRCGFHPPCGCCACFGCVLRACLFSSWMRCVLVPVCVSGGCAAESARPRGTATPCAAVGGTDTLGCVRACTRLPYAFRRFIPGDSLPYMLR